MKAEILCELGRFEESLEAFEKAIELEPDDEEIWYSKACCLSRKKDILKTMDALINAIGLSQELKERAKSDKIFEWLWQDKFFILATENKR